MNKIALGFAALTAMAAPAFAAFVKKLLKRAVAASDWPTAGANLNRIRQIIAVNLPLGLLGQLGRLLGHGAERFGLQAGTNLYPRDIARRIDKKSRRKAPADS